MRLIDADALHDALRKKKKWVVRYGDKHSEGYTSDQVHFAINDAPTVEERQKGNWIPCSERLPNEDEEVLVYLYGDTPYLAYVDSKGRWCTDNFLVGEDHSPLAWMPLPQPYLGNSDA